MQKLIDKNGGRGGLAHVAFRVRNAQAAFQYMMEAGFQLIDKGPRPGSRGTTVFFVHPKSLGVLIEIVEELLMSNAMSEHLTLDEFPPVSTAPNGMR